jgi:RNA polymerase sigma-70 factor (sigma-E family)
MDGTTVTARRTGASPSGSEEGFEDWVRASATRHKRLAFLLTGDLDEAEDLLQTAYARVLPKWGRVSAYDSPDAYVRRVMVNLRTSRWRRLRDREWTTDSVPEPRGSTPDLSALVVQSDSLLAALRRLPARQRAAVVLRHWCDLSEAETASVMGCSAGTVKSTTSRGLTALRSHLSDHTDPSDLREGGTS